MIIKISTRFAVAYCAIGLISSVAADTFMMKDGSTLDGKILKEDTTSYVIEINVTKSIKDERVVQKADVLRIKREKLDLIAFEKVEKLVPAPDLLTADGYAERIAVVKKFLAKYPKSSMARKSKNILATLTAESEAIAGGSVKMHGKMLSPEEYQENAYAIDAGIAEREIRSLVKETRYLIALRKFDEFDRDFRNTDSFRSLLPLMSKVAVTYVAEIQRMLSTFDSRVEKRVKGLELMARADRLATESAISEELAALEARYEEEKKENIGWITTHRFFKPALEHTVKYGEKQLKSWDAAKSGPAIDGGKAYRDALSTIRDSAEKSEISAAIGEARNAKVPQRYLDRLDAAAAAKANP